VNKIKFGRLGCVILVIWLNILHKTTGKPQES